MRVPNLWVNVFIIFVLPNLSNGQLSTKQFKLTDGQNGVKSIPIPYRATDQCMPKIDAKHGKTTYGLSFRLHSKGGHCDGGLLICYPGMLNRHADSLDFKVKGLFQIDNKKDNKVNQYCSSKMQKEGISAGQTHWRGIKVYTMPNGTQNHETMLEASVASRPYKLGTNVTQFFIHLGGNGTDLLTMITVNDGKPFIDNESNLQKQFREQFWNGAFLREHTGLWMLGLDVLPSMEQENAKLFIARDCNCTMEAWFIQPTDLCFGEKMVYSVTLNDSRIIRGKRRFNCSNNWLLERYKLSDKYAITKTIKVKSPGDPKFVFVTATDDKYYPSFRMLIANIKEKFGCKQHIIAYDLGKVTKNKEWMNEINSICNLEWRIFNFTQMADDRVRDLKSYAWKIFVIAQIFSEFDTFVWLDTSIFFESNNLAKFLVPIQSDKIGSVQVPSYSGHGMNRATHPGMYKFLPMYTNYEKNKTYKLTGNNDPPQFETLFIIVHKSEESRQLMKWIRVFSESFNTIWNTGTKKVEDPSFLPQISSDHPGMDGLFYTNRYQTFRSSNADWLHKVQCC
ncbi:hypothetical protein GPALN_006631 [Globodera pallida]|nr:hypothetical protein GPALN_006631 [Globodera pallida]